ncbi:hypothetical protein BC835DRAFT_1522287, partial [Cytidiella melzeri]
MADNTSQDLFARFWEFMALQTNLLGPPVAPPVPLLPSPSPSNMYSSHLSQPEATSTPAGTSAAGIGIYSSLQYPQAQIPRLPLVSLLDCPPTASLLSTPPQPAAPADFPSTSSLQPRASSCVTHQPFLGHNALALLLGTHHVNQQRLASASHTIPH